MFFEPTFFWPPQKGCTRILSRKKSPGFRHRVMMPTAVPRARASHVLVGLEGNPCEIRRAKAGGGELERPKGGFPSTLEKSELRMGRFPITAVQHGNSKILCTVYCIHICRYMHIYILRQIHLHSPTCIDTEKLQTKNKVNLEIASYTFPEKHPPNWGSERSTNPSSERTSHGTNWRSLHCNPRLRKNPCQVVKSSSRPPWFFRPEKTTMSDQWKMLCFRAQWFGIQIGVPPSLSQGDPRNPNHRAPNHQLTFRKQFIFIRFFPRYSPGNYNISYQKASRWKMGPVVFWGKLLDR